jgi:hypothetical protein
MAAKTHCKHGHMLTAANVYTRPNGERACRACREASRRANRPIKPRLGRLFNYNFPRIRFCRRNHAIVGENFAIEKKSVVCRDCRIIDAKIRRKSGNLKETTVRRVIAALESGMTLSNIEGRRGDMKIGGNMIDTGRLKIFCAQQPKLGKRILALAERNRFAAIKASNHRRLIVSPAIIRTADDIMEVISAAVPPYLSKDHRDDVIQNIWMAVLERKLKRGEIKARACEFIRSEYRTSHNAWGPRSLDVPIYLDSNTTLLDTLTRGLWD